MEFHSVFGRIIFLIMSIMYFRVFGRVAGRTFHGQRQYPPSKLYFKKPSACVSVSSSLCSVSEELEFHLHFNPISTESTPNEFRGIIISRGKLNLVVTISMDGTFDHQDQYPLFPMTFLSSLAYRLFSLCHLHLLSP